MFGGFRHWQTLQQVSQVGFGEMTRRALRLYRDAGISFVHHVSCNAWRLAKLKKCSLVLATDVHFVLGTPGIHGGFPSALRATGRP
jgi:hypothetical protein